VEFLRPLAAPLTTCIAPAGFAALLSCFAPARVPTGEGDVPPLRRRRSARPVTRANCTSTSQMEPRTGPAVYETRGWPSNRLTRARRAAIVSGPRDDKGALVGGTWVEWDVTPWVTRDGPDRFASGSCGGRRGPHGPRDEDAATARRHDLRPALVGHVRGADGGCAGQRGNSAASTSTGRDRLDRRVCLWLSRQPGRSRHCSGR
jgi:hypothetical protein